MKTVVKSKCIDAGLQIPDHVRECKVTCIEKNTWVVDDWTDVSIKIFFFFSSSFCIVKSILFHT